MLVYANARLLLARERATHVRRMSTHHSAHGVPWQELLRVAAALAGASPDYDPERPGYCSAYPRGRALRYEVAAALTMLAADPACVDLLRPEPRTPKRARTAAAGMSAEREAPSVKPPAVGSDGLASLLTSCTRAFLK